MIGRTIDEPLGTIEERAFLKWVLGHEIGHIMKGHAPSHFGPDELERALTSTSAKGVFT